MYLVGEQRVDQHVLLQTLHTHKFKKAASDLYHKGREASDVWIEKGLYGG